jgi:hypothetical protein
MFPDLSEFDSDEMYPTDFRHKDGRIVGVYSSSNQKSVSRHFKWMKESGIECAFVQRFVQQIMEEVSVRFTNKVLENARNGAKEHGRTYTIMYDLSGATLAQFDIVKSDFNNLVEKMRILDENIYQKHKGKHVITIWGVGFSDRHQDNVRGYLHKCLELVEFFKSKGMFVILGLPAYWRELTRDSVSDPFLHQIIKQANMIQPWFTGRWSNLRDVQNIASRMYKMDQQWSDQNGLEYMPVIFPGFSWHNLFPKDPLDKIPRLKGRFLWEQVKHAKNANVKMIFQAMFDEVNEGTAILKVGSDQPVGKFLSYEGLPNDFYLRLVGNAARCLKGEIRCDNIPN